MNNDLKTAIAYYELSFKVILQANFLLYFEKKLLTVRLHCLKSLDNSHQHKNMIKFKIYIFSKQFKVIICDLLSLKVKKGTLKLKIYLGMHCFGF